MRFHEVLNELNINLENRLFTVCDGAHAGEKMIVSSGEPVWMSDEEGFFAMHGSEAVSAPDGRLTEIGGERVFAELLGKDKEIVICGAGHVSMPVIAIAKMMGFRVTAVDDRESFIQNALDRGADEGMCMAFGEALDKIPGGPDTYFIIVTRGHRGDAECLLRIVKKPFAYVGMIGSRRKVALVKQTLADAGVPQDVIDSVHTPIGLDIGAETPEEIAVAIMAEIIEVKNKGKRAEGFSHEIMKALLSEERDPAVMATIISKKGSAPRGAGTRMLVMHDGSIRGTIGGGCAEATVMNYAKEALRDLDGKENNEAVSPVIMHVDMTGKQVEEDGMICGGAIEVLLEIV
ncbi:MAG: xanthine dehydrogenase [Clostridiales bacterium]|nr:xanthine dehydrogenase [Clostridiales bacterium]